MRTVNTAKGYRNPCFVLRVNLYRDQSPITIYAFDDLTPGWDDAGRVRLTCEVRQGSRVVFPYGQLTCALHGISDGIAARELVMSLVAMAPDAGGGEGEDYYADYTPDQIAWANEHHEAIDCERQDRYCDDNGGLRVKWSTLRELGSATRTTRRTVRP